MLRILLTVAASFVTTKASLFGLNTGSLPTAEYLGCFWPDHAEAHAEAQATDSLEGCLRLCMVKDTQYAGITSNYNCYCANERAELVICEETWRTTCGHGTISLYKLKDGNVVGFLVATKTGLVHYKNNKLSPGNIKLPLNSPHVSIAYNYNKNDIYVSANNKILRISFVPAQNKHLSPKTILNLEYGTMHVDIVRIALDWVDNVLYYVYHITGRVYSRALVRLGRVRLGINTAEVLVPDIWQCEGGLNDLAIDPFERKVFYMCGNFFGYYNLVKEQREHYDQLSEFGFSKLTKLAIDIHNKRAYMTATTTIGKMYLISVNYDRTDLRVLQRRFQLDSAFSLNVMGDQLFWGEKLLYPAIYSSTMAVRGNVVNTTELVTLIQEVKTMKLYHADAQKSPQQLWTTKDLLSHHQTAVCSCPRNKVLSFDGKYCQELPYNNSGALSDMVDSDECKEGSGAGYIN